MVYLVDKYIIQEIMLQDFYKVIVDFSMSLIGAIVVLIVGLFVIKHVMKLIEKLLDKSKLDATLKPFLRSTINILLKVFLFIVVVGIVGIETGSIIAVLGAASLAVGLAFQGTLANLASGIILILMKPLRAGDFIEVSGKIGTVIGIEFFSTKLLTLDNKVVFIPNSTVLNSDLTNYSMKETRRVDQMYGVGYESDIDTVKRVIREEIDAIPQSLQNPEPFVAVAEHGDSSVNFVVRVWTKSEDYWTVHFALLENIKKRFDKENINIPYPTFDINQK